MMPGGGELLVVFVMIFLLFGGRELPKIARTLGKWTAVLRRSLNDVRREFNRLAIEEELKEASKNLAEIKRDPLGLNTPNPNAGKYTLKPEGEVKQGDAVTGVEPMEANPAGKDGEWEEVEPGTPAASAPDVAATPEPNPEERVARGSGGGAPAVQPPADEGEDKGKGPE